MACYIPSGRIPDGSSLFLPATGYYSPPTPGYSPVFSSDLNSSPSEYGRVLALCEGDLNCVYDVLLTGDDEAGLATLDFNRLHQRQRAILGIYTMDQNGRHIHFSCTTSFCHYPVVVRSNNTHGELSTHKHCFLLLLLRCIFILSFKKIAKYCA